MLRVRDVRRSGAGLLDAVYGEARDSEGRVVRGLLDGGDDGEGPLSGLGLAERLTQEMTSGDVLFSLAMANISCTASQGQPQPRQRVQFPYVQADLDRQGKYFTGRSGSSLWVRGATNGSAKCGWVVAVRLVGG